MKDHGIKPWREEGLSKLVDIEGSLPPSLGEMYPNKVIRQKCMDEQAAHGKTQMMSEESLLRVEARTLNLGGIQKDHLSSQRSG